MDSRGFPWMPADASGSSWLSSRVAADGEGGVRGLPPTSRVPRSSRRAPSPPMFHDLNGTFHTFHGLDAMFHGLHGVFHGSHGMFHGVHGVFHDRHSVFHRPSHVPHAPRDVPRAPRDVPRASRDVPRSPRDVPRASRDVPRSRHAGRREALRGLLSGNCHPDSDWIRTLSPSRAEAGNGLVDGAKP